MYLILIMNEIVDQLPQFINNDIKILWKYF